MRELPLNAVTWGLSCNVLYKGTLAAFDNGTKPIVMHRSIVCLKLGTKSFRLFKQSKLPNSDS